mmetsp:Transcript_7730/g.7150  ORF Transcript_7730/g.7150 Transcript_7730/m.7150 type:complete len:276 (+) Transcript_7730:197-1024(+)
MTVAEKGYQYEINHAFFPLFPYLIWRLASLLRLPLGIVGFVYQLSLGYLNTLLLYKVARILTKNEVLAFNACMIFIFNHSLVYQVSQYSEPTFIFLSLLGILILYRSYEEQLFNKLIPKTIKSKHLIPASLVFGVAILCRSNAVFLEGVVFIVLLSKIVHKSDSFFSLYKLIFYFWAILIIMLLPLGVVLLWKPYIMHCETKLDRTDAINKWCLDEIPSVYSYIQELYWDNKVFGFLERKPENFLVSIPMNLIFLYITLRFLFSQFWNVVTLGIF